jgi:hypothetical protein
MTGDDVKRASAVAGIGAFVLTVLCLLAFAEPGHALLTALLSGLAVGLGVAVAGSLALLSRPVVRPAPRVSVVVGAPVEPDSPAAVAGASLAAALAGGAAGRPAGGSLAGAGTGIPASPHDTSTLTVDDVVKAQDLHQTVRLDQGDLQYALAELTPEEILKDREGIDEAFLKAGIGLEETPGPSENVGEGQPGTGGKT